MLWIQRFCLVPQRIIKSFLFVSDFHVELRGLAHNRLFTYSSQNHKRQRRFVIFCDILAWWLVPLKCTIEGKILVVGFTLFLLAGPLRSFSSRMAWFLVLSVATTKRVDWNLAHFYLTWVPFRLFILAGLKSKKACGLRNLFAYRRCIIMGIYLRFNLKLEPSRKLFCWILWKSVFILFDLFYKKDFGINQWRSGISKKFSGELIFKYSNFNC